jgi:hypothetical protein
LTIKTIPHERSQPPKFESHGTALQPRQGPSGGAMKPTPRDDELTADDLECLWAIARRATIQDRLVESRGMQLEKKGLIELTHQWPTLTPKGLRILKECSAQAILDLHRDPDSSE